MAVGTTLAILFAPQSGEETREQLSEQSIELRRRSMEGYQRFAAQFQERYGDAIAQAREAYPRTRQEIMSQYTRAKNGE